MKAPVHLLLFLLAMVLFLLAGLGLPAHPRFQYIGWGLFLWCLSQLVSV